MIRKFLSDESGYSLVEVIVSVMLLSIAIIPMVGMFDAGLRAAVTGSNYDRARTLANSSMENVKALPYTKTNPAGVNDSVVELFAPGSPGVTSHTCPVTVPAGFSCKVETQYLTASLTPSSIQSSQTNVVVKTGWGGVDDRVTITGLVVRSKP